MAVIEIPSFSASCAGNSRNSDPNRIEGALSLGRHVVWPDWSLPQAPSRRGQHDHDNAVLPYFAETRDCQFNASWVGAERIPDRAGQRFFSFQRVDQLKGAAENGYTHCHTDDQAMRKNMRI